MSSFGLCCFKKSHGAETELLILRRRYTYNYCSIVYNNYRTIDDLRSILKGTTVDEKITLWSGDYSRIWDKMWISVRSDKYIKNKMIFDNILQGLGLEQFRKIIAESESVDLSWELPKGRKETGIQESDLECASREFTEETGISRHSFKVIVGQTTRCHFRDFDILYTIRFWAALLKKDQKTEEFPKISEYTSLGNETCYEHDIIRFVPMSGIKDYLPGPIYNAAKSLYRAIKKDL